MGRVGQQRLHFWWAGTSGCIARSPSLIELGRAEEDVLPVVVQLDDPLQEGRARTWRLLAELARPRKD